MFENLFGNKEYGTIVYFRNDDKFTFWHLPIEMDFYVEKVNDVIVRAWQIWFKLLKRFDGYKNLKPGRVTLAYSRDIVLDLFNQLSEDEKPSEAGKIKDAYKTDIFETTVFALDKNIKPHTITDKVWISLGTVMVILGIGCALKAVL